MSEHTRDRIANAMRTLLKRKPLAEIHVTDICQEAEIKRTVFYSYFKDKYDLMAWMFLQYNLQTDVISLESASQGLDTMRKDPVFYKRLYEDHSQVPLWSYMLEYYTERYKEIITEKLGTDLLDEQTIFSIRFYTYATLGMSREWFRKNMTIPAEEVVKMMFQCMPENLRKIFF